MITTKGRKITLGSLFRYTLGGLMLALVGFNAYARFADWVLSLLVATAAVVIMIGGRRVFRPAVTNEFDTIICRYAPWHEAGIYVGVIFLALMGICGVILGFRPGYSMMFGVFGFTLLALTPFALVKFLRGERRCLLRITPEKLIVPLPSQAYALTVVPRDQVESIAPGNEIVGFGSTNLLISEIVYKPADSSPAQRVLLGPAPATDTVWLTVEPSNLLAALQAWKHGDPVDPALMDRVDKLLRGQLSQ